MIISTVYALAAVFSLLLLVAYFMAIKKKESWFLVLFTSICVVNIGYFFLSISDTLDGALWANRLSYLGSVFLPLSMFIIILNVLQINYSKWLPRILIFVSVLIFLVAASPGYLDIYYEHVSLTQIEGATFLVKDYGSFHLLYYAYLALYFLSMVICLCCKRKKISSNNSLYSDILVSAVFLNIAVWLLEQFVDVNFEILSISYIMTGVFILFLKLLQTEFLKIQNDKDKFQIIASTKSNLVEPAPLSNDKKNVFISGLSSLTPTEEKIYNLYLQNKTTKEIMELLDIKENTLKFHNKNIYGKLGVTSRKELVAIAKLIGNRK